MQSGNQTVRQRKQKDGDESDSPTSDVAHQTIQSQENLDKKNIPRLTLLEEVFLLGLKDSQALRGCILMELSIRNQISTTKESKRRPISDRVIDVTNDKNTGEALLDEALRVMKTDKQSITDWIDLLSGETWNVMKIGYQMKQVRERIAKGLVDKGVLRTEKKNFLLFDMATHPLADSVLKQSVTKKVIDALLGRGVQPDIRLICLICAAYASNVLENVLGNVTFSQRETAFQKAEEICNEFCAITDKTKASGTTDIVAAVCIIYSKMDNI